MLIDILLRFNMSNSEQTHEESIAPTQPTTPSLPPTWFQRMRSKITPSIIGVGFGSILAWEHFGRHYDVPYRPAIALNSTKSLCQNGFQKFGEAIVEAGSLFAYIDIADFQKTLYDVCTPIVEILVSATYLYKGYAIRLSQVVVKHDSVVVGTVIVAFIGGAAVVCWETVFRNKNVKYRPSFFTQKFYDGSVYVFDKLGNCLARICSFLTFINIKDVKQSIRDITKPAVKALGSPVHVVKGYCEQVKEYASNNRMAVITGTALFAGIIGLIAFYRG